MLHDIEILLQGLFNVVVHDGVVGKLSFAILTLWPELAEHTLVRGLAVRGVGITSIAILVGWA